MGVRSECSSDYFLAGPNKHGTQQGPFACAPQGRSSLSGLFRNVFTLVNLRMAGLTCLSSETATPALFTRHPGRNPGNPDPKPKSPFLKLATLEYFNLKSHDYEKYVSGSKQLPAESNRFDLAALDLHEALKLRAIMSHELACLNGQGKLLDMQCLYPRPPERLRFSHRLVT